MITSNDILAAFDTEEAAQQQLELEQLNDTADADMYADFYACMDADMRAADQLTEPWFF